MFYMPLAVTTWAASVWMIDWRRLRELLLYGLVGSVIADVENHLGRLFQLWDYRDTGILGSHEGISLIIAVSAAPLFSMYFAQGLKPGGPVPWLRIVCITSVAMVPEVVGVYTGHMVHGRGWTIPVSVVAYLPTWLLIWALHHWIAPER